MLPTYAGDAVPELRRLAKPDVRQVADLWMLSHPDLRNNRRLRATRACVVKGLKRHDRLFLGTGWCKNATAGPKLTPSNTTG